MEKKTSKKEKKILHMGLILLVVVLLFLLSYVSYKKDWFGIVKEYE